ncbi:MAG: SDR family oxidoreductase [Chitinophagaceae bacterium]|nr:MAG: SDR family oxidoreductase [Chitinophagaceae bacterium]
METLLNDKIIFLTGGSMGIGLECARKYLSYGALTVIMANDKGSLDRVVDELQVDAADAIYGDVTDAVSVEMAIERTVNRHGRIDVIHNNAGIASPASPLHQTTDAAWSLLFDVNVRSILYSTRYGIETLKQSKGCIINTSSLVAGIGQDNHAAYVATKGAVNALTKAMALDYAPYGVRVNAVAPAGVRTEMLEQWITEQPDPAAMNNWLDSIHPLGACPKGDVIADACVFLASGLSGFITGCVLPVSGGAELGYRTIIDQQKK